MKLTFFFSQTANFDKSINLFCLVFLTLEFSFAVFFYNWHNTFPLLLIIRQYFLTINFIVSDFIIIPELNLNPYNLVEILSIRVFLLDSLMSKYCIDISINIKLFSVRVNSNNLTTRFLFYCILSFYFVVNIFVAVSIFINFCW